MEITPIRNETDYHCSLKEIEGLMNAQPNTADGDRLEILVTLVEAYEARNHPIAAPDDPVEVLGYYMESRGLSRADLIPYLGSKERVSDVLNYKRGLSLAMIRKLHIGLGIPADLLIGRQTLRTTSVHAHLPASSAES